MLTNPIRKEKSFLRILRYLHLFFRGAAIFLVLLLVINAYVLTFSRVNGHSMEPTLKNNQLLMVNEAAFWFQAPKRDDVIIVQYAGNTSVRFVKRIVGLPGDTVTYNGLPLTLSSTQYFIEGDNRNFSTDSRVYGPIERDQIIGKVLGSHPQS